MVTSLTRPTKEQPRNASKRSVHPAGIAVDLRVPPRQCRQWLRETLSAWERLGFVEATRERRPPHFHVVALLHNLSTEVIASLRGGRSKVTQKRTRRLKSRARSSKSMSRRRSRGRPLARHSKSIKQYRVRRGDSLWRLSRKWGVSENAIKRLNHLRSDRIDYGQMLLIP